VLFNSLQFLAFLPVVFFIYWVILKTANARILFMILASYLFYMSWNPKLIILIILSTLIDYYVVIGLQKTEDPVRRKLFFGASILFNLGVLAVFKYANFFLHDVVTPLTGRAFPHLDIILPLGISFYTFETLSYVVDCYYKTTVPFSSLRDYAFFISFFPHLIAGPIIRPKVFLPQVKALRELTREDVIVGLGYFLMGLLKKVVVADHFSRYADVVFADPASHGTLQAWGGVLAYAMQIYCDFSGYSEMAIGLGRLFAIKLPVNFRTPYMSRNVAEFWKRWHISLSTWLRDYLFIPVRGLWPGEWNSYFAMFTTMFLGGLWHGANWTFVAWGAYHGALLMIHRALHQKIPWLWKPVTGLFPAPLREVVARLFTFFLACVGWTFFRAQTFGLAFSMFRRMFSFVPSPDAVPRYVWWLAVVVALYDLSAWLVETKDVAIERRAATAPFLLRTGAYALALFLLLVFAPQDARPFIYFQF
jgi:alginate O-acetyltransferase complex protein AlgI